MRFDKFELSVVVPSNRGTTKIPEYGHNGLTFVEGRRGQAYSLRLRNDSALRVMAVVSVDGTSIVDGQPCGSGSRGYVIPGFTSVDINGWRTSLDEIHRFQFTEKAKSYAGSSGSVQNCGIIAAKFFSEKFVMPKVIKEHHHHHHDHYYPWPTYPWPTHPKYPDIMWMYGSTVTTDSPIQWGTVCASQTGDAGVQHPDVSAKGLDRSSIECSMASSVPDFKLGTGWGEASIDQVGETQFDRATELCTLEIYYAEAADLEKVGIKLEKEVSVSAVVGTALPQAFPGFCRPPVSQ